MNDNGPWTVILAGGDGTRLRHLSVDENGAPIPKQFWRLDGHSSMLGWTLHRTSFWSTPFRTVAVVAADHRPFWESELGELPTVAGLVGGALCLLGVAISRRTPRSARPQHHREVAAVER